MHGIAMDKFIRTAYRMNAPAKPTRAKLNRALGKSLGVLGLEWPESPEGPFAGMSEIHRSQNNVTKQNVLVHVLLVEQYRKVGDYNYKCSIQIQYSNY